MNGEAELGDGDEVKLGVPRPKQFDLAKRLQRLSRSVDSADDSLERIGHEPDSFLSIPCTHDCRPPRQGHRGFV